MTEGALLARSLAMGAPALLVVLAGLGSPPVIQFRDSSAIPATLSATCGKASATTKWLDASSSQFTIAYLQGVPAHCALSRMQEPCASSNPAYPKLFTCTWSTVVANSNSTPLVVATGPVAATAQAVFASATSSSSVLAAEVFLKCPVPSAASVAGLPAAPTLRLAITHAFAGALAFDGLPNGDVVTLRLEDPFQHWSLFK